MPRISQLTNPDSVPVVEPVDAPETQLFAAEVIDDAAGPTDAVRCVIVGFSRLHADDGYAFDPFVTGGGVYLPKKGCSAVVAFPREGEPYVAAWRPKDGATPDESVGGGGGGGAGKAELEAEAKAREAGDEGESSARTAAVAAEALARSVADSEEKTARESKDAAEKSERESKDATEKSAREAADNLRVLKSTLEASGVGFVNHKTEAGKARPTGYATVVWLGSVEPTNATATDLVVYENSQAIHVPAVRAHRNGVAQTVGAATFTELLFTINDYDNSGMHSTVTNTGRLVAPKAGVYMVTFGFAIATGLNSTTGLGMAVITKNGSNWNFARVGMDPNGEDAMQITAVLKLEAGDYVGCLAYNPAATGKSATGVEGTLTWLGSGVRTSEPVDWGVVSALPTGAEVGDYCTFKTATNTFWRLQKVDATTYPWAVIHGPALPFTTSAPGSPGTTYTTMATASIPSAVKVLADIEWGFSGGSATANTQLRAEIFYGSTEKAFGTAIFNVVTANANGPGRAVAIEQEIAAGTTVTMKVKTDQANASSWYNAELFIRPRRVG